MTDRRLLVLLVEDDADISELTKEALEECGLSVVTAANGLHALALLDNVEPDVIVTDLMMPVMDGFAFIEAYRKRPGPHRPVMATSSLHAYLQEARKLGVADTLPKPYDVFKLAERVTVLASGKKPVPAPLSGDAAGAEVERLREVMALRLEQPSPGEALKTFTERVARAFEVPICLVSAITENRQYWTAHCGLPDDLGAARGTPRDQSFCTHSVVGRTALVVQDAVENPFFRNNHLVKTRGLRFYAGVPLIGRKGHALGTLCLLAFQPKGFGYFDLELLAVLAKRVLAELEWRERHSDPSAPLSTFSHLSYLDEELDVLGREALLDVLRVQACRSTERHIRLALVVAQVPPEGLLAAARALSAHFDAGFVGRLDTTRLAVVVEGTTEWAGKVAAASAGPGAHVQVLDMTPYALAPDLALCDLEAATAASAAG